MTHQTNDIILRIRRYFRCLWMALIGRNPYIEDSEELWKKIGELEKLKENYCMALDRWEEASINASELSQSNVRLTAQANNLRNLVENLRERIREKDRIIDEYEKSPIYNNVDEKQD